MEPQVRANALARAFAVSSVVPLATWLGFHLGVYASVLWGADEIGASHAPSPVALAIELLLIWLPFAFHALFGVVVWLRRRKQAERTPSRKALLALHRLTGLVLLPFLIDHFVRFRLPILRGERFPSDSVQVLTAELSRADGGVPWLAAATVLGTASAAFHLGYGLCRVVERSPQLAGPLGRRMALGIGLALGLVGVFAVVKLATG